MTEYVIRGNSAILKCSIPSYIAEFVNVEAWIREDGETYLPNASADMGTSEPKNRLTLVTDPLFIQICHFIVCCFSEHFVSVSPATSCLAVLRHRSWERVRDSGQQRDHEMQNS